MSICVKASNVGPHEEEEEEGGEGGGGLVTAVAMFSPPSGLVAKKENFFVCVNLRVMGVV